MTGSAPVTKAPTGVAHTDVVAEAARLLHRHRPGWETLLREHVPDRFDHCARCRTAAGWGPEWPCTLYWIGRAAQQLAETPVLMLSPSPTVPAHPRRTAVGSRS